jgi:hypothetical protein
MIAKFRERWDKLKESAKRKKEAKAVASALTNAASASGEGTVAVEGGLKPDANEEELDEVKEAMAG